MSEQLSVFDPAMEVRKGEVLTSSLEVARVFGKRHDNLLNSLAKLECSEEFGLLNFKETSAKDSWNRDQKIVLMTKNGFTFLVMGLTGKKAAFFKEQYIKKFDAMEKRLANQRNAEWLENRQAGKLARRELTDALAEFVEYARGQGSSHAEKYYITITKMAYKCLHFIAGNTKVPQNFRDLLDSKNLGFLQSAEYVAEQALKDGMDANLHYKEIYTLAKNRVDVFAQSVLPVIRSRPQLSK